MQIKIKKNHKTSPYFSQKKCHQINKRRSGTILKSFEFRYCAHLTTLHILFSLYNITQYCIFQFELYSCLMNHWACLVQCLYYLQSPSFLVTRQQAKLTAALTHGAVLPRDALQCRTHPN